MGVIVFLVVGLILLGWATPSEAAAFGAVGVLILALAFRCLSWQALVRSVSGALKVTVMAFMIVLGSATFSQILAFSGASSGMLAWATAFDLSPLAMLLVMFGVLLLLGMFMDQLSMMLITVPIFFPLAQSYGFDLIWFGVIVLMALEISFTTPPFGLLLFVMRGVAPPGHHHGRDLQIRDPVHGLRVAAGRAADLGAADRPVPRRARRLRRANRQG